MFDFSKLKSDLKHKKEYFLNDVKDFFIFNIVAILGTLIFYRQTQDEFTATLILSALWIFFWKESDLLGKVFLVSASLIGYTHELLGVAAGYFTYLGGFFGGVPLYVFPGYGAIFWASYHFWDIFEKTYISGSGGGKWGIVLRRILPNSWRTVIAVTAIFFTIDIVLFDLTKKPALFLTEFFLVMLLWKSPRQILLAYFVAFFTVFDEFAGEILGAWSHESFSLVSLSTGYMFLLWMATTITDTLHKSKAWAPREIIGMAGILALFAINTYIRIAGLGGF